MANTLRIYHNPRCSKSRQTLALIEAAGQTPEIILYLENPPSTVQLRTLVQALGFDSARQLLRKNEDEFKTLQLASPDLSEDALLNAMANHPKLIERPIVVKGKRAVLGRPPENVQQLL